MNSTLTAGNTMTRDARPKVFYDGGCPLCRREISHYMRLDRTGALDWVDIHTHPEALRQHDLSWEAAMQRLHVLESDGRMVTGAYAFAAVWRQLPYYRRLSTILALPGLLPLLDRLYSRFARWRWQRRCDVSCDPGQRNGGIGNGT